jgi:hypothetical protein
LEASGGGQADPEMRLMLVVWMGLIAAGIAYFTVVGLTHG